jgi:predicted  nucleic acid-binding Zn-ribbon protein
VSGLPQD